MQVLFMNSHPDQNYAWVKDRLAHQLAEAKQQRLASLYAGGVPTRPRVARCLVRVALVIEAEEVWHALWEELTDTGTRKRRVKKA